MRRALQVIYCLLGIPLTSVATRINDYTAQITITAQITNTYMRFQNNIARMIMLLLIGVYISFIWVLNKKAPLNRWAALFALVYFVLGMASNFPFTLLLFTIDKFGIWPILSGCFIMLSLANRAANTR